jgi:hypothetical protein
MGHFFAAAQVPLGLGNQAGLLVEIQQWLNKQGSAFQGEDLKSNALGTIFGLHYLNNSKEGKTLAEKLSNFFRDYENDSILFQPQEHMYGMNSREQLTISSKKIDAPAVIDNDAETVGNAALTKEKEALLKELEELNSSQANFPTARERSTQRTL